MFMQEALENLTENINKVFKLCKELKDIFEDGTVQSWYDNTVEIEALLLDSFVKNKKLIPYENKALGIVHSHDSYQEYVDVLEVSKDCLHFRIPILNNKFGYKNRIMFDELIMYVFATIIKSGAVIPRMKEHTIIFTHVLPTASKGHVPDNDNYDVRVIINDIAVFIGSSDNGVNSWQVHRTILSDEMEMGTYIKVVRRTAECY